MTADTDSCLFCRIVRGEIPSRKVHETDSILAFEDVHPIAPLHLLIIPKKHLPMLSAASPREDHALLGDLLAAVPELAAKLGLSDFRVVCNNGGAAGQTVFHLHLHLVSGRAFTWPPG